MDIASIAQVSGVIAVIAPILLLLLAAGWIVSRTVSLHILARRLWLLVHGNHEIADPEIRAYVEEQTSLMSFRMFSGVRADSLQEAHQLLQWARLNGVEMRKIGLCGEYFDTALRQVRVHKLPATWWQHAKASLSMCFYMVMVICLAMLSYSQILIKVKATQEWVLADEGSARLAWPPLPFMAPSLQHSECLRPASTNAARTSLSAKDVEVLCAVLGDKSWKGHLATELTKQRWALSLLAVLALALCLWSLSAWIPGATARRLAARHINPGLLGTQRMLDFQEGQHSTGRGT